MNFDCAQDRTGNTLNLADVRLLCDFKFGCLAVYLRGDCARKDCVVFVSDICNFQR